VPRTIVLAHGILGFVLAPVPSPLANHFNGAQKHLEAPGHNVRAPGVAGSVVGSLLQPAPPSTRPFLWRA
jgi:hypothetical protein